MRALFSLLLILAAVGIAAEEHPDEERPGIAVLLVGNSHSAKGELPKKLRLLLEAGSPEGTSVVVERAPRWAYLADRLRDDATQNKLDSRRWTHVVLQAQRYSTSGRYSYPTDGAKEWIRRVRRAGAIPVLFPEWGQRGNRDEGLRVHGLHESIADVEAACVAPVGIVWEVALDNRPKLRLHAVDGNHANNTGALLTAHVLYEVVSGRPAAALPAVDGTGVKPEVQAYLATVTSSVLEQKPACERLSSLDQNSPAD